jgi:hypothetical protein
MPLPDICVADRQRCPNEYPVLRFNQETRSSSEITLRDLEGIPYPLLDTDKVCLVAKFMFGDSSPVLNIEATIVDAANGVVKLNIPPKLLKKPGILVAELVVFRLITQPESSSSSISSSSSVEPVTGEREVVIRTKLYIEVAENLTHFDKALSTISVAEVRLALRDRCPEANFLLDDVEFNNEEIAWAIRRPVDYWNERPPPIGTYTAGNFPYRFNWLNGTISQLMLLAAPWYERNNLTYQAAGLSVNDKNKAQFYAQWGASLWKDYTGWVNLEKKRINMESFYGITNIAAFGDGSGRGL